MNTQSLALVGFGPDGWGKLLLLAAGLTLAAAVCSFALGSLLGTIGAALKLAPNHALRWIGTFYTTLFRGIPEILVVYLFYFGGSLALTHLMHLAGFPGFFSLPSFVIGVVAIALVSGAYQTEAFRSAYCRLERGQIEAGKASGMSPTVLLRRIIAPQTLRFALPALGNIWQSVLKETALLSIIGLVELLRQSTIASGATRQPLLFYGVAALVYLIMGQTTALGIRAVEKRFSRCWGR
ncbi:ABC transporter permease subunit [Gluconobacter sp. GP1]|uniref:ABC transporter permease n=1 Tax=Gluconobacter sp. GP1 TaxID=3046423 RepID=UPI00293E47F3|nr:ABC transporter permease subunit [Gluconobacter sp. GP1]